MLTRRQREVLLVIEEFKQYYGYAPTIEEIGMKMGLSSKASVFQHLDNLQSKGYIKRLPGRARSIEIIKMEKQAPASGIEVPLVGNISAGEPLEAIEEYDTISIPSIFGDCGSETFVLKVKGDSMIDDHILNGDYVIVERRENAVAGNTVVALLNDGEAVIKKFFMDSDEKVVRLEPRNKNMKPIIVREGPFRILGVVIGMFRDMREK